MGPDRDPARSFVAGVTFRKSHGATCGACCDEECGGLRPATPPIEKSHPGGLYDASPRENPAGRGAFGEPWYVPSALYLQPICSRERILIRVDNPITAGRDRAVRRPGKLSADTTARRHNLLQEYGDLVERAKKDIHRVNLIPLRPALAAPHPSDIGA